MRSAGHTFVIPAIADYELRRELIRSGLTASVAALDFFNQVASNLYLPLSDAALHHAASLWAQTRNSGKPTAKNEALDVAKHFCIKKRQSKSRHFPFAL